MKENQGTTDIDKFLEEIEETHDRLENDEEMTQEQIIEELQNQIDNIDKLEIIFNDMRKKGLLPGKPSL